jgi:cytosine/adenosine deaminase-related metal-dependent hydrolase
MTYRKFKGDYLFLGDRLAESDSVLITTDDGTVQDVVPAAAAGGDVVYMPGLLCPGFVNSHCHLELSHMRGVIPQGTGLVDFLGEVIRRRGQSTEGIKEAIAAAEQEMLDGGIVAVGDICNTADTLEQKLAGRLYYHNFIETIGFVGQGAAARFEQSKAVYDRFGGKRSLVPHAPYSVSAELFRLIAGFAGKPSGAKASEPLAKDATEGIRGTKSSRRSSEEERGTMLRQRSLLTMHNQETDAENDFLLSGKGDFLRLYAMLGVDVSFFHGTGKRSLESCLSYFNAGQTMILVHNVATTAGDLDRMAGGPDLYFCLCPNANLYISGQLPDVELLLARGCRMVVGTDSLASNHRLSVLDELKTLQQAFPKLDTVELLGWATLNGARALQMQELLGSFSPGKRPGVVLLNDLEEQRLAPATTASRII